MIARLRFTQIMIFLFVPVILTFCFSCSEAAGRVKLYFFWGEGCPHCSHEKEFLSDMQEKYPELQIESYEVWKNRANAGFLSRLLKGSGMKSSGVPVTFIDRRVFVGFSDRDKVEIEKNISRCSEQDCIDPVERLNSLIPSDEQTAVQIPLIGTVDASRVSIPLLAVLLGALDSFNPCAFFVLFFLLSLLVHARSRARMFIIGGTFVLFSGIIYFVFMAAWLNLFLLAGNLPFITAAAGSVALFIAIVNIKDFFWFRKGISLSIPETAKPRLFDRMRRLLASTSLTSMLGGTLVLAIAANTYELLCTAGFPMVFTRALTMHNLSTTAYYLYLALYNVIYIIPLGLIVMVFTVTLGARKLSEWQGRKLKLASGLMMSLLGLTLLIRPALLNNIFAAAGMLVAALVLSWIIIQFAKRRSFGTEQPGRG